MTFEEIQLKAFDLTENETKRLQRQMIKEYEAALREINKEIRKVYLILDDVKPENYFAAMTKYNRLVRLQETISKLYADAARKAGALLVQNSELAINNLYYRHFYAVNWTQAQTVFAALHPAIIEASVFSTSKIWDELRKEAQNKIIATLAKLKITTLSQAPFSES